MRLCWDALASLRAAVLGDVGGAVGTGGGGMALTVGPPAPAPAPAPAAALLLAVLEDLRSLHLRFLGLCRLRLRAV